MYSQTRVSGKGTLDPAFRTKRNGEHEQFIKHTGITDRPKFLKSELLKENKIKKIKGTASSIFYRPLTVESTNYNMDDQYKSIYTYDNYGNCLSCIIKTMVNGTWVYDMKGTYTYDKSGNLLSELGEIWLKNSWANNYRETRTYDNSGNMLTDLKEEWRDNKWNPYESFTYTYNTGGNVLTYIVKYCSDGVWQKEFRMTSSYDNSGNQISLLSENGSNNDWVNYELETYTYNYEGGTIAYVAAYWNNNAWENNYRETYLIHNPYYDFPVLYEKWVGNKWVMVERCTYCYDKAGNVDSSLAETLYNGIWQKNYCYKYTHDASGHMLTDNFTEWNSDSSVFSNRDTFTYDNFGNCLSWLVEENWYGKWVNGYLYNYVFDSNENCIRAESYQWKGDYWAPEYSNHNVLYNYNKDSLEIDGAINIITYSSFSVNPSENFTTFNLKQNYPNPFNISTSIDFIVAQEGTIKLSLYNITGSKVATIVDEYKPAGNYSIQFNAANLASGIYLYKLEVGNFSAAKKFILLK